VSQLLETGGTAALRPPHAAWATTRRRVHRLGRSELCGDVRTVSRSDNVMDNVMDELLAAFEAHVPERFKTS
jgi:hypothetical protein